MIDEETLYKYFKSLFFMLACSFTIWFLPDKAATFFLPGAFHLAKCMLNMGLAALFLLGHAKAADDKFILWIALISHFGSAIGMLNTWQ